MFVPLTDRLRQALRSPSTMDIDFDATLHLQEVLNGVGLSAEDSGGSIDWAGADPIVPSTLRLGAAAGLALVAKSVAVAKLWQMRGGPGQDISMDLRVAPHRLCPFYDKRWELLNGYPPGAPANPNAAFGTTFYETRDGRWVMPLNEYPRIKVAAQRLLGTPEDVDFVAAAIRQWQGNDLEEAGAQAGVVMPLVRSTSQLLQENHYTVALADTPLIEIVKVGDADPEPLSESVTSPLSGIKALGMGHVIAGSAVGRALALHGADVLNLWRPDEFEHDNVYLSANVGVRSATVSPHLTEGAALIRSLLRSSDVFYANRRPGYLERLGLSAEEVAVLRPGIVHATVSLHGRSGPWASLLGFDQTAGCVSGIMLLEGVGGVPALPPIRVVNDYITSWLLTTGVLAALMRRSIEGGSWSVHVSLTRVALWILSLGIFDKKYAVETAGTRLEHSYMDPETFVADTALGRYQGVTDQVRMSQTPGSYHPVLVPRGSCRPVWIEDV